MRKQKMVECRICREVVDNLHYHIQKHHISKKDYFDKFLKTHGDGFCDLCGNPTRFCTLQKGYKKFCSIKCSKQFQSKNKTKIERMLDKRKQTNINKYGVDHPMKCQIGKENLKSSILKKYNVEYFSTTSQFKKQFRETCQKKYGVNHFNQNTIFKEKRKHTLEKKHGVDNVSKMNVVKQKIQQTKLEKYGDGFYNNIEKTRTTCLEKYGTEYVLQSQLVRNRINQSKKNKFLKYLFSGNRLGGLVSPLFSPEDFTNTNKIYKFKCNQCNSTFLDDLDDGLIPKCPSCFRNNNISKMEEDFLDYLKIVDRQIVIGNYKVDGIKGNKVFEFFGDYWHGNPTRFVAEEINPSNKITFGQLYNETKNKLNQLSQMGYDVYYIWENDWLNWLRGNITTFPIKCLKNYAI